MLQELNEIETSRERKRIDRIIAKNMEEFEKFSEKFSEVSENIDKAEVKYLTNHGNTRYKIYSMEKDGMTHELSIMLNVDSPEAGIRCKIKIQ